ncbi:MAG: flagellar hook-basal body complex protein FliE [Bacteroidetes bacterium HLUCCA01]|nr:MAG: flagellar hook-basal body complex protein FliE [Bacteroidetes bacterium HLUCCA01]
MNFPINVNSIRLPESVGGVQLPQGLNNLDLNNLNLNDLNLNELREQLPEELAGIRLDGTASAPRELDGIRNMGPMAPRVSGMGGPSFGSLLSSAIKSVDESMKTADQSGQDFLAGKTDNVHDVMINMQRAQLSFQMLVEIRNKAVEAYQELSRMQI